ncbi:MAG: hypothetical protein WCG25_03340 [bacterium]
MMSHPMRSVKDFDITFISFIILLFCNISNFDIINLTTVLSARINTSLLQFLICLIRWFQIQANSIMTINTKNIIIKIIHQRFTVMMVNIAIMFISILISQFEKTSITILCRLSHHFCNMLFDCHVHSHSILLLSAFRYLDKYSS